MALHDNQDENRELTISDFQSMVDQVGVRVKIRSSEWMTPFRVNDRQAKHNRVGDVFLAGDASHIHSPVGGQGMNTGIQDVANIAWKLAAVDRGADDALLNSYEEERGAVGRELLRFTERGLKLATVANPLLERLRDTLAPLITSLPPVQQNAIGFISETAIEYRSSSIVADYRGDGELRAGDRLPDLNLRNGRGSTLLRDWTSPQASSVALNAPETEVSQFKNSLRHADVVTIESSDLDEEGLRLLGKDSRLIILRPDGYVGFRAPLTHRREFESYARQDALA